MEADHAQGCVLPSPSPAPISPGRPRADILCRHLPARARLTSFVSLDHGGEHRRACTWSSLRVYSLDSSCRSPLLGCLPCCGGAWRKGAGDGGEERSRWWRGGIDPAEVQQVAEATRSLSPRQLRRRGSPELQVEDDGGHRRAECRPCRLLSASCRSICDARSQGVERERREEDKKGKERNQRLWPPTQFFSPRP